MIRNATLKDIYKINNIGKTLLPNFLVTYNMNDYINNDKYIVLVNEDDDVNGFLIILNNIDCYELEVIVVNNKNCGIGSSLINYFLDKFNKKDIILEVSELNKEAINFYKKFDFEIMSVRKNYYSDNSDAYIMKRVVE